jgi:3-deoxy-D-manno-octulosonic acid kinase
MTGPPHPEYHRLETARARGVALGEMVDPLRLILGRHSLYAYAGSHADRRELPGRGLAYAIPLAAARVVVRHVRHGGLLAPITGDVFLTPTRAPYELAVSQRLRDGGVPTPQVVAYVTYPAGPFLRRADVVTREIAQATDLGTLLAGDAVHQADRAALWEAAEALIEALGRVGAYHADLNVTNVLLAPGDDGRLAAHAIDVDRVVWGQAGDPALVRANRARLHRSARKRGLL